MMFLAYTGIFIIAGCPSAVTYVSMLENSLMGCPALFVSNGIFSEKFDSVQYMRITLWAADASVAVDNFQYYSLVKMIDGYENAAPESCAGRRTNKLIDGYRLLQVSREALKRMQAWGFMYQMTGNDKYYTRAMADLDAICAFSDWHPEHFLDTAEMMTAAAVGYDWFYERMTTSQRGKLAEQIIKKGLEPTRLAYYGRLNTGGIAGPSMNFVMASNNMNIVDNCGAIVAATAVFEQNPKLCSDVIEKAVRSLDYSLSAFAPDGAWEEGINYWIYSMEYLTRAICALDITFGSDFGLSEYEGLDTAAAWAVSLDAYNGVNSYHDTWDGMRLDTFALAGLGKIYGADALSPGAVVEISSLQISENPSGKPAVYDSKS